LILALTIAAAGRTSAAQRYDTPEEAYRGGVAFLSLRQYEKARAPLEQALKMAADDPTRIKVNRALLSVYFHAGETDKVIEALDVILSKSKSEPERAIVRRALLGYLQTQGKTDEVIRRYEDRIKKDPNDIPALYVLSDIYAQLRPDPRRSGALVERLAEVMKTTGGDLAPYAGTNLAAQYVKAGKFQEGAALYEKVAANDPTLAAWNYKEAAQAWLKAGDKARALAAARSADAGPPENRNKLLEHFWHRALGDVYLQTGEPARAIPHYEQAIAATDIAGYLKDTQKSLAQARALVARTGPDAAAPATTATATAPTTGAVDLNRASFAELQAVEGISEALAIQIIDRRKSKPFTSVSELIELDDVDKELLARIRPALTVGPPK
jgi:tetratricopeptide (TPR) repeat protein